MYYPLMIELKNKKVYIIGGGKVALRKAKKFLEYGANVHIISPKILEEFYELQKCWNKSFYVIKKDYDNKLIEDAFILVGATNNEKINKSIAEFCNDNNILCNIVDNKEASDFIVPSTIKRGELIISVSTLGNSPSLCSKIRKELEEKYDSQYEEYVNLLGIGRKLVLNIYNDEHKKKEILNSMINMSLEELKNYISILKTYY